MRRTQGALAATQAAVAEGVVAGGGTALLRSGQALDALEPRGRVRPRRRGRAQRALASRCTGSPRTPGYDGQAVIDQVRAMPDGHGLDALTGDFGDLAEGLARPSSPI